MKESGVGRKDSNPRLTGPKPDALPLGHAPFRFPFDTNNTIMSVGYLSTPGPI